MNSNIQKIPRASSSVYIKPTRPFFHRCRRVKPKWPPTEREGALTVSGHADGQTLLEPALLAAVAVAPHDGAVLHFQTLLVLDVLLDAPAEKSLRSQKRRNVQNDVSFTEGPVVSFQEEQRTALPLQCQYVTTTQISDLIHLNHLRKIMNHNSI